MKQFIAKVGRFIFFFVVLCFIVVGINYVLLRSSNIDFAENRNILVLGDSNAQCAINDSIFSTATNLALNADSYFYSYLKIKRIVETNQPVDTLLLSFAPHNIFKNGWIEDPKLVRSRFRNYFGLMNAEDLRFIVGNNPRAVLNSAGQIIRHFPASTYQILTGQNIFDIGSYLPITRNTMNEDLLRLKKGQSLTFFELPKDFTLSTKEIHYLEAIMELCKNENIKLYLINLPKREELLSLDKYGVSEFEEIYRTRYEDVDFIDFSRFPLPDGSYADPVHLNLKGAALFSSYLRQNNFSTHMQNYAFESD
ncbi:hypothetical protein [Maribacter halichondriae]|uniref:hypothetical protein n=1 Tax=Maribacter halichondriae TaxID=2980554 RepID=UPI002359CF31|nr:hypothetical protein [Maribacter sp. Hal144]